MEKNNKKFFKKKKARKKHYVVESQLKRKAESKKINKSPSALQKCKVLWKQPADLSFNAMDFM